MSKVEYFILLGDIFDFCFGDSRYFQKKYKKIGESLSSLAQKNINVLFFQGNHEFAISKLRWRHVQFIEEKTKIITLKHGAKIALSHGDTLNAPLHYYFYLFIARSKLIHLLIRLMPSKYLDIFTQKFSRYSRKKNKQHKLALEPLILAANRWLNKLNCCHGVFGHYHIPFCITRTPPKKGYITCLKDWSSPNYLTFDGQKFRHVTIDQL